MASSPAEIITRIPTQFAKAKQDGDLFFYPSTVHSHTEIGIDVRSRPTVINWRAAYHDLVSNAV